MFEDADDEVNYKETTPKTKKQRKIEYDDKGGMSARAVIMQRSGGGEEKMHFRGGRTKITKWHLTRGKCW